MNNFLMFLIKIWQLKFFLKIFLLFECKKVQFGPQNIIWGLKNEYFFNVFDQNMAIENFFENFSVIWV